MISSDAPIMRLQRLLEFDLLRKGSFYGIESAIIEFVCQKLIKFHERKKKDNKKDARVMDSAKYFSIFFEEMEAYKSQEEEFERR